MRTRITLLLLALSAWVCTPVLAAKEAKEAAPKSQTAPRVQLVTSMGNITLELDDKKAPITVKNFLAYVDAGHYSGTIFHRVIDGFMIQGGGFNADMVQKTTLAPITLESKNGLKNLRGTIAMARTNVPNSATSQFFINVVDNANLDYPSFDGHGYAVFGRVIEGMDVVDKIKGVAVHTQGMHQNIPIESIVIQSAKRLR